MGWGTRQRARVGTFWAGLVALLSVAALLTAAPALASPPAWTGSGTGSVNVPEDGTQGPAEFTYDNGGPTTGGGGASGNWTFQTTALSAGTVKLAWSYAGSDAFYNVVVGLNVFVTHDGSTSSTTLVAAGPANCCDPPSGSFSYSGTTSVAVAVGDTYGFTMSGSNFDTNTHLYGTLNVTRTYIPTISTAASAPQPVGAQITDAATLTGTEPGATGTITFNAYGNAQCSGAPLSTETATVGGDGTYDAPGFTPPGAGTYYWTASYSGDSSTQSVSEGCGGPGESSTVTPQPTISTTPSGAPVTLGGWITDSAVLAETQAGAAGTITFNAYFRTARAPPRPSTPRPRRSAGTAPTRSRASSPRASEPTTGRRATRAISRTPPPGSARPAASRRSCRRRSTTPGPAPG